MQTEAEHLAVSAAGMMLGAACTGLGVKELGLRLGPDAGWRSPSEAGCRLCTAHVPYCLSNRLEHPSSSRQHRLCNESSFTQPTVS